MYDHTTGTLSFQHPRTYRRLLFKQHYVCLGLDRRRIGNDLYAHCRSVDVRDKKTVFGGFATRVNQQFCSAARLVFVRGRNGVLDKRSLGVYRSGGSSLRARYPTVLLCKKASRTYRLQQRKLNLIYIKKSTKKTSKVFEVFICILRVSTAVRSDNVVYF